MQKLSQGERQMGLACTVTGYSHFERLLPLAACLIQDAAGKGCRICQSMLVIAFLLLNTVIARPVKDKSRRGCPRLVAIPVKPRNVYSPLKELIITKSNDIAKARAHGNPLLECFNFEKDETRGGDTAPPGPK